MATVRAPHDAEEAESRQRIYGFLASAFLLKPSPESMSRNTLLLHKMLENHGSQSDLGEQSLDFDAIEQMYYDCFFVPTSGCYVPPYESALLDYDLAAGRNFGKLNGSAAQHIALCWKDAGFEPGKLLMFEPLSRSYLPDHIGLELAFMAFLCGAEKTALTGGTLPAAASNAAKWREYQYGFLREHLCKWTGNLAKVLCSNAPGYYADVAVAVAAWVESDSEELIHMANFERNRNETR
jgi:TorA maturation chaperone TorD